MPQTETQNASPATNQPARGRKPGQPARDPAVVAIENLEQSTSRLLWYLSANPSSAFGVKLARCGRAGVEKARAQKALELVEAAVATARTQFEASYAAPQKVAGVAAKRPDVSL